ncbi:M23 family metallopeptidase [Leucobacter viscericola]|uniref:M23 family metallopeptidase n=1 Tax=Leucobacter viscericola TaxID=2714935 RepID=A0A6G7XCB4_9MICO|nr:M23 family metallopeptidase [Leucobacter viscericola]QIK62234.1 M23 family metallopeptidase [Leucobacter viscericola]
MNSPAQQSRTHRSRRALAAVLLGISLTLLGATASASSAPLEASPPSPSPTALWIPPVGHSLTVSGPYLGPPTPYASGHRGIDLPAGPGLAVRAPTSGTVTFVGTVVDRGVLSVRVDERTVLSLEPITSELRAGDAVSTGQFLGTVSSGGHCYEECLHVGVRVEEDYVNPLRYFRGRPKLRPW